MAKFKKNNSVFTIFESDREIEFDEVKERCEINDRDCPEEDSHEYYLECMSIHEGETEDFYTNLKYCKVLKVPCMVTGELGLWNGHPSIVPMKFDCVEDAVKRCVSRDIMDIDVVYNKGAIEINCYHHDGTNCFNIRKLSKKGKAEVEKEKYLFKDYEPKDWWFCQFKPEEIF